MTESHQMHAIENLAVVTSQLDKAHDKLRACCEAEGLLPIYDEVLEYFCGKNAYPNYSLNDWLADINFQYSVLQGSYAHYRISLVMAHLVSARTKANSEKLGLAMKMLRNAEAFLYGLREPLPSVYLDSRIEGRSRSQKGGHCKNLIGICRSLLECLKDNHRLDAVDFKSSDEAINHAIEMLISNEQYGDEKSMEIRRFYPQIFRNWLRINPEESVVFKEYTGFEWCE